MAELEPKSNEAIVQQAGPLKWFAGNHVAANLLMLFILVAGAFSFFSLKREVFQEIDPDLIRITVPYPGATPEEVEESICLRVEEAIKGIDGIKKVRAVASENTGTVIAELEDYANDQEVLDDVKQAVDRIEDFPPKDADEPIIIDQEARVQAISMVIYGDASERTLKELAEQVRDELTAKSDISLVEIEGAREYELSIEVSEAKLRRHGLTFKQVADVVAASSLDLPGGVVKSEGGEILLRTKGRKYVGRDFRDITVISRTDGSKVYLKDVATIIDGFEDTDLRTYFDGKRAVLLKVFRVGNQDALTIERIVDDYIANTHLREGVKMATWFNRASYLRGRMDLLTRNAAIGLVLVFLCLALFLDLRLAFWTTLGIPISFMGGFIIMTMTGVSINMISLFALIVVLGIVVDDAIVVGENVFAYRQQGMDGLSAAIKGVREMAMPVTLAILTTIAAFAPLLYTEGMLGKILWPIPAVVIAVLLVSLVEALLILPAHLSTSRVSKKKGPIARMQRAIREGLQWWIDHPYAKTLALASKWRYATMAIAIAVFVLTIGWVRGGHIKFHFLPPIDADNVWVTLNMPQGTPVETTRRVVDRMEKAIEEAKRELAAERPGDAPSLTKHVSATVGGQPFSSLRDGGPGGAGGVNTGGGHLAEINVELLSSEQRTVSSKRFADAWRKAVGEVAGAESVTFTSTFFSAGDAVNVQLSHRNFDKLLLAVEKLKRELEEYAGVIDIADSFEPGKRELTLKLKPAGRASGLTLEDLARQVRQAFFGEEAQRIQRGRDDIKVMVRYPEDERESLGGLHNMRVRLLDGTEMPFDVVASVEEGRGYAVINRTDRRRVVSVTADVDGDVRSATDLNDLLRDKVLPRLQQDIPGLGFDFEGEEKERAESLNSMGNNMIIGLLVIYGLLAVQFRSYMQPVIVMSAIPFGVVGAVLGHIIMGLPLTMLSGFGMVALTGVVVNDSLIMIDLINRRRREEGEEGLHQIILESGTRRFRPILLTTMTTFFGLMPMILETSLQAQFLIPMAVSLGFGVMFATAITLIIVPCLYRILEDVKGSIRMVVNWWQADPEADDDTGGTGGTPEPATP